MTATVANVKELISTSKSDGDIATFLASGQSLYDALIPAGTHVDALADKIVAYLAAHFLAVTVEAGWPQEQKMGDAMSRIVTPADGYGALPTTGLSMTRFGQTAIVLDTSGKLAKHNNDLGPTRPTAGTDPEELGPAVFRVL